MDASYWLAANMNMEAWLGFNAFNTEDLTGSRTIDFVKYRQLIAEGAPMDEKLFEQVLYPPKNK
jgi:6-oxo-cyclohex-1-ene-carbonyl-CoA hydrolase